MSDDESKRLFTLRVAFGLEYNMTYAFSMMRPYFSYGGMFFETDDKLLSKLRSENEIIVFCTGGQGSGMMRILMAYNIPVAFCSDNSANKWGSEFYRVKIISPDEIVKNHKDALIIIASYEHQAAIYDQLVNMGIPSSRLCIYDNGNKLQYFDTDIISPELNTIETFVDGGCYNFNTSAQFLDWAKGSKSYVIAFEPDANNVIKCQNRCEAEKLKKEFEAQIIAAGMWSKSTELRFNCNGSEGSQHSDEGDTIVPVKALDDVIGDRRVTLLKMDIEGAELEALYGAADTIRRDKPRCAICVYHKPEDIYEITSYLHELVPEYRFYMRHYSLCDLETVLYAKV